MIEKPSVDEYGLIIDWPRYNEDDIAAVTATLRADTSASSASLDAHKSIVSEYGASSSGEMYTSHVQGFSSVHTSWADRVARERIVAELGDNLSAEVVLVKNSIINEASSMQTHIKEYYSQADQLDEQADSVSEKSEADSLRAEAKNKRDFAERMKQETQDWVRLQIVNLEESFTAWDAAATRKLSVYPNWSLDDITPEVIAQFEDVTEKPASTVVENNNNNDDDGKDGLL